MFYAYIPLLEVVPNYQGKEIGKGFVERMLEASKNMHAIDIACDEPMDLFYEELRFFRCVGMVERNYKRHSPSGLYL